MQRGEGKPEAIRVKNQTCLEFLKCFFTTEERAEKSDRLARAISLKVEADEEFKAVKSQFKDRIDGLELEIAKLARQINLGYEHRNVACEFLLDSPTLGRKTLVRLDIPGEVVRTEDMTDSDKQMSIPGMPVREPEIAMDATGPAIPQNLPGMEPASVAAND